MKIPFVSQGLDEVAQLEIKQNELGKSRDKKNAEIEALEIRAGELDAGEVLAGRECGSAEAEKLRAQAQTLRRDVIAINSALVAVTKLLDAATKKKRDEQISELDKGDAQADAESRRLDAELNSAIIAVYIAFLKSGKFAPQTDWRQAFGTTSRFIGIAANGNEDSLEPLVHSKAVDAAAKFAAERAQAQSERDVARRQLGAQ